MKVQEEPDAASRWRYKVLPINSLFQRLMQQAYNNRHWCPALIANARMAVQVQSLCQRLLPACPVIITKQVDARTQLQLCLIKR